MNPFEIHKTRKLRFAGTEEQFARAYRLLADLEHLEVQHSSEPNTLILHYSLEHYSLEGLEKALLNEGFQFADSLLQRLHKLLLKYVEDVQYHNLRTPEHHTKKNPAEIFAQAYEQHPHGDRDETPKELREYK